MVIPGDEFGLQRLILFHGPHEIRNRHPVSTVSQNLALLGAVGGDYENVSVFVPPEIRFFSI